MLLFPLMERVGQNQSPSPPSQPGTAVYISGLDSIENASFGDLVILTDNGTARDMLCRNFQIPALCCAFDSPFSPALASLFKTFRLAIIPTREGSSEGGAIKIAGACRSVALSLKVISLPRLDVRETVADWMRRGGTRAQLLDLIARTPDYRPSVAALSQQQLNPNPVLQPASLKDILHDPELQVEAIVAFNRILDAVKCPAYCRAYPLAVMSAFAETFNPGGSFDGFQTATATVGGYLSGRPSGKKLSRESLRKRSTRAEALFNRWQQASGYCLILRHRDAGLPATAHSIYSTPLIAAWRRVLETARDNPRWAEGKRKRAQAIRHAASQIATDLLSDPIAAPESPASASGADSSKHGSSGSNESGLPRSGDGILSTSGKKLSADAEPASRPIDQTSDDLSIEHANSLRMMQRSFNRIASRLPRKPLRRRSEPALKNSELVLRDASRLVRLLLQTAMTEFSNIVDQINMINSITGSNLSSTQLFSAVMEPFVTGQLVPPQNRVRKDDDLEPFVTGQLVPPQNSVN